MDTFALNDHCIVPWKDGSMYAGRVQKILDPERRAVIQTVNQRKGGKFVHVEEATPLDRFKKERLGRMSASAIEQSQASGLPWFYIHYSGWKQSHDEWIPEERMLAYTPKHIAEMKRVNAEIKDREREARLAREAAEKEHKQMKKRAKHGVKPKKEPVDTAARPQKYAARGARAASSAAAAKPPAKRTRQTPPPAEDSLPLAAGHKRRRVGLDDAQGLEIKISVPLDLKRLLVQDWELVTHSRHIVQLPRSIAVVGIMAEFVAYHHDPVATGPNENLEQFADSIITYFDYALGMILLYRFERNQYYAQRHPHPADFRPSLVYGAEHLARLIVSMPALLAQMAGMDDKTTEYVVHQLNALAKFLTDNRTRYFAGEKSYSSATRVYEAFSVPDMQGGDLVETDQEPNGDAYSAAVTSEPDSAEVA